MHLETLDAVHQESKRLPPIPKVYLDIVFISLSLLSDTGVGEMAEKHIPFCRQ